ncbi:LamG-like jellyroll fold domain-containing protein [Pontibacter ruber]|uniref:LamG-like jellyroll fold domain-containing protein n=1 Tax=Pontibacter ruber TaxID=1343895 RepID=A0ABW5CV53_9BACT|nr:LamG-like jellyroll fold domain-containing protein [Pontibacter ruber]
MGKFTIIAAILVLIFFNIVVHPALGTVNNISKNRVEAASAGFSSIINLSAIAITEDTGEKPQAKVWTYAGKHWAVLASSDGTNLWRLDGTTWTNVLKLSPKTSSKADCKLVGNITHIFLYQGRSSQLVSVEYNSSTGSYQLWSRRTNTVGISLDNGVETATIDIDSKGRMWLTSAGTTSAYVRWSDAPYNNWSEPITVTTGITDDDICAVVALSGKIGVFWSNQNTQRFGFKTHIDGADPATWSADEVPASQSAIAIGNGMSDDHMNIVAANDGVLYCAIKTSYNTVGYPTIALLVRRPAGTWDRLYDVTQYTGTRPIIVLNESMSKVRVVYTTSTSAGDIVYKESSTSSVSFGSQYTLIKGAYNDATSTKIGFNGETVVMASNTEQAVSVLVSDNTLPTVPSAPVLASPSNGATDVTTSIALSWNASAGADSYQVQVSTSSSFSSTVFDYSGITTTSTAVSDLANSTTYYWRARATNSAGSSSWSTVWSITTISASSPTNPLVGHWKLDEGSGMALADASEYKNNATAVGGATWVAGVTGQALRFNGSSQYATVADNASLDITGAITLTAWIKPEKIATQYVFKKAEQNSVDGYELSLSSGGLIFFRFNQVTSGDTYRINSTTIHPSNGTTWIHVAVTYGGGVMRLYINGDQNNSKTFSSPPPIKLNGLALTIGAGNNGYRGFQGAMDDVRIYNTALSASEVKEIATVTSSIAVSSAVLASPQGVSEQEKLIAYPNPFTTTATVNFTLSENGDYTVKLYDSRGALIADLKQGMAEAGKENKIEIDSNGLTRGLYIIRLQADGVFKSAKLVLDR